METSAVLILNVLVKSFVALGKFPYIHVVIPQRIAMRIN